MKRDITILIVSTGKTRRLDGSRKDCIFCRMVPAKQATSASSSQTWFGRRRIWAFPAFFLVTPCTNNTLCIKICCFPESISRISLQIPSDPLGTPWRSHLEFSNVSRLKAAGQNGEKMNIFGMASLFQRHLWKWEILVLVSCCQA